MDRDRQLVIVVAKQPVPGRVKTRLCPPLSPEQAAGLAVRFLDNTIGIAQESRAEVWLGYAPDDAKAWFVQRYRGIGLVPQGTGDLGERMARLFEAAFRAGFGQVALVGTDTPALTTARIEECLDSLAPNTLVLGPSEDGGYYLIGLTAAHPALFEGAPWSTDNVFVATMALAEEAGLRIVLLPFERDVDTPNDLRRLERAGLMDIVE